MGGPVADLAGLVGEVVAVESVPIDFKVEKGKGTLKVGDGIEAEIEPLQGATGFTTLNDSIFSNIPGSPAYVSKAPVYKANVPELGFNISLSGHNAVQGSFRFVG